MASYLGAYRLNKFVFAPATCLLGTRGGLILLWDEGNIEVTEISKGVHHLSTTVSSTDGTSFRLTNVYGPS